MGLDFSHGEAHFSYGGFHQFRQKLAEQIGINLDDMQGFGGSRKWDDLKDDIIPLLNHSDCDGELSPKECAKIAPRLKELISSWEGIDDYKYSGERLVESLEEAAECNEHLEFC